MADKILHKRSLVSGSIPTTSSLDLGELAINVNDGKLYLRQSGSTTDQIVNIGESASFATTASYAITASYALNGGGTTIDTGSLVTTASFNAYTGSNTSQFAGTASYALTASYFTTPIEIQAACSDEITALTTGTAKVTFRTPCAITVTAVRASLTTAQASGNIFTVDINEGGTSILSTKLTIDNTELTSTTATTPPVISDTTLADDAEITIDIDQIGDGTAKGLKVTIIGTRI